MYQIVEFEKDPKHKPGATNPITRRLGQYKLLIDAEKAFYRFAQPGMPVGYGIRIEDTRYGSQREFFNGGNPYIYVKASYKNDVGKYAFQTFSLTQYRRFIAEKSKNLLTQTI